MFLGTHIGKHCFRGPAAADDSWFCVLWDALAHGSLTSEHLSPLVGMLKHRLQGLPPEFLIQ